MLKSKYAPYIFNNNKQLPSNLKVILLKAKNIYIGDSRSIIITSMSDPLQLQLYFKFLKDISQILSPLLSSLVMKTTSFYVYVTFPVYSKHINTITHKL